MRFFISFIFIVNFCCAPAVTETQRPRIYKNALEIIKVPAHSPKKAWPEGTIQQTTKGQASPMDGIVLSEERAKDAGLLRIRYDELHAIATANHKFMEVVLKTGDQQLEAADKKNALLRSKLDSWWNRNKVAVGVVLGIVCTSVASSLLYWSVSKMK